MIVEDIIAFQDAIKSKTEMNDKFLDKITQKFKCFLIINEQDIKHEINTNEKETRVMIIDRITELDPYFLVIFNNTIIFISDLLLLQKTIPDFEEYHIFTFSENLDTDFPEEFHIENEKFYALKIIQNCSTSYDREYDFYSNIHHPLIPRFYGKMNIEDKYGLIIEYINGKKLNEIDCRKLTDEDRFYITMQLMITVEYIHLNKFICRDLKPDNLIVDKNKNLILIDFDQSINLKKVDKNLTPTIDFSTIYASPELKENQKNAKYTEKIMFIQLAC